MTTPIKLIVIDLDKTLLNDEHQMTDKTEATIKKAIEQGIKVVLATGKTYTSAKDVITRTGIDTPGIYVQGLAIHYPDGNVKHLATLEPDLLRKLITFAEDRGYTVAAYSGERILVKQTSPDASQLSQKYHEPEPEAVGPIQNVLDNTSINKMLVIKKDDPRKITALRWQLSMQMDGRGRLVQAIDDMLEILPPGASKGKALKSLLKELNITPENVLAIGDGENDIEMIEMAGIGVAVGNASDKLKEVADYVVASNNDDGVAEAIERFALKKEEEKTPEPAASQAEESPSNVADSGASTAVSDPSSSSSGEAEGTN